MSILKFFAFFCLILVGEASFSAEEAKVEQDWHRSSFGSVAFNLEPTTDEQDTENEHRARDVRWDYSFDKRDAVQEKCKTIYKDHKDVFGWILQAYDFYDGNDPLEGAKCVLAEAFLKCDFLDTGVTEIINRHDPHFTYEQGLLTSDPNYYRGVAAYILGGGFEAGGHYFTFVSDNATTVYSGSHNTSVNSTSSTFSTQLSESYKQQADATKQRRIRMGIEDALGELPALRWDSSFNTFLSKQRNQKNFGQPNIIERLTIDLINKDSSAVTVSVNFINNTSAVFEYTPEGNESSSEEDKKDCALVDDQGNKVGGDDTGGNATFLAGAGFGSGEGGTKVEEDAKNKTQQDGDTVYGESANQHTRVATASTTPAKIHAGAQSCIDELQLLQRTLRKNYPDDAQIPAALDGELDQAIQTLKAITEGQDFDQRQWNGSLESLGKRVEEAKPSGGCCTIM